MRRNASAAPLIALLAVSVFLVGCERTPAPTREEIVAKYPDVESGSTRAENKKILCPFVRMLERAGLFDEELAGGTSSTVAVKSVGDSAKELGCSFLECNTVASVVSNGQSAEGVDLERLHEASGVAHDCGLTFALGGTEVSDSVRNTTLNRLAELADDNGELIYDDLLTAKLEICAQQGVEISSPGALETKLIFAYLGGVERGSVPYSDVVRFLNAEMPATKTTSWVNASLLNKVSTSE